MIERYWKHSQIRFTFVGHKPNKCSFFEKALTQIVNLILIHILPDLA